MVSPIDSARHDHCLVQDGKASGEGGEKIALPPDSPLGQQAYRDLAPVFDDMMKGFLLRVTFESYAPIDNYRWEVPLRNADAHPHTCDLVHFSSENLDNGGDHFLENEEVMLALLRGHHKFFHTERDHPRYSHFLAANLADRQGNHTLPMLNRARSTSFMIKPSRPLFDKLLAGKTLEWGKDHKHMSKTAKFEEVGWRPKK